MQGQGNSVESFAETFEFDRGSAMSNPGIDHQVYLNDSLRGPVETQSLQEYRLSSGDTNMPYANATSQDSASLNMWNSSASRSGEQTQNLDNHDETKMEHAWTVSLTGNGGGAPRNEEGRFEASNMRSTESVNINLSNHHMDNNLPFSQSSHSNDFPQNFGHNIGYVGTSNQTLEAGMCPPYNSGLSESKRVLSSGGSSNACESSSRCVGSSSEGGGRQGDSLDGWRLPCKRKNIEGLPEQASASGSSTWFRQSENSFDHVSSHYDDDAGLNISRPSEFLSDLSPAQPDSRIGTNAGIMVSDSGNAERSRRSLRIRINPTNQHGLSPPPWAPVNRTAQQFPLPISSAESLESGPVVASSNSENQFYVPVTLQLPRDAQPENGASSSRIGSSPSNPIIVGERSSVTSEETNIRSMLSSNSSDQPAFRVETETRQSATVPPNWDLANGGTTIPVTVAPASLTGTSSVVHQSLGSTAPPHHAHHRRRLSEIRQLLTTLGSSASGGQGVNAPQRSLQPVTSQDVERPSGAGIQGYRLDYVRSAIMDSQRDGVPGIPVFVRPAAASREQRSRMISEIRHVLDLMRRGDNLQPEDVHLFDRYPYFGGGADLLDRHRDMRLDVDNMSYEELLALEERIGDVSTGLSEETVLKRLKQRQYVSVTVEASAEVEPCCICQEEYIDGQELGIPDCEHEFHTDCIKQWLMQKNICPICKTTALATTSGTSGGEGDMQQQESEEAFDE